MFTDRQATIPGSHELTVLVGKDSEDKIYEDEEC